jgi:hypothetical protein
MRIEHGISLFEFVTRTTMMLGSNSPFHMQMNGLWTFPREAHVSVEIFASEVGKKVARTY